MALYRLFQRLVTSAVVIGIISSAGGSDIFAGDGPYDPAQAPQQTGLRLIESDDPLVQREGSWTTQTTAGASGGSYLYNTGSLNDVLTLSFTGTTLEVVYVSGPTLGFMAIQIDEGIPDITVPTTTNQIEYGHSHRITYLSEGPHTARIYGQAGNLIAVDAFYAEIPTTNNNPTCPSELSVPYEDIAAFRNAINLANSDPDVTTICLDGGYTFTNATTGADALPIITTNIIIEGNGVTLTRSGISNLRFYEIASTGRLTLRNQILLSGSVTGNGGGILNNGGSLTLDNVWLHMGHANGNGAGIYSNGGTLQIQGSTFASNTAANGAGLYTTGGTTTSITHTTFAENSATQDGGALYNGGPLTIVLGGFANNSAGRYGGAIHNHTLSTATLNASIFDANTAVTRGGAINNQGTLTLTGNTLVYHNTVTGSTASGGGVYNATGSQLTLRYTVVTENTAANGGGIRSEGTLSVESNTEFTLNQATQQGGALYIGDGVVTITNTRILSNTAGTNGGAIFNASTTDSFSFSDSLMQENYATVRGGGFYSAGPLTIEHSNLHSNGAGTQGGGIYLTAASDASAHNSCIVENSTPNAVHNAGTTARSFTTNWWGAADGPSGVGPGSGDAISNYITYTDFLSTDSPCASTLPALPPTLSCQSWQDGLAYGWTDSSSGGPYVVWDTNGMYGNASGTGTWTVSAYYDVASLTPAADTWYFRFTDNGLEPYQVYQGPAAPTPGTTLGSLVAQNADGFYNITEDFVQLVWSVETPLNLSESLQLFSFCSTTQPPIPNRGPIVTAGPDQVLLIPDYEAQLSGNVFDQDQLPGTGTTSHWEVVSGPGTAAFEPHPTGNTAVSDAEDPTVTFSTIGVYVLRLTGSDGLLSATDDVTIVVSDDIDLTVQSLDTTAFEVDHRTLEVSGTLSAQVANLGDASTSIEFTLLFFEDVETQNDPLNGVYDLGVDHIVAQSQVQALAGGASVVVTAQASGTVSFAGIPIHAFVDSTLAITETNEANNTLSSIGQCVLAGPTEFATPTLVQQWAGSSTSPTSVNVAMAPVVADLNDDGRSDIIFISSIGSPPGGDGTLRAITWNDSNPEHHANELFSLGVDEMMIDQIAVGDISGDEHLEILATSELGELVAFAYSAQTSQYAELWRRPGGGSPALADLDNDGLPEIITNTRIFDHNGTLRQVLGVVNPGDPLRFQSGIPIVADLDMDGSPEIISGNLVYRADGQTVYWHYTNLDSITGQEWSKYAAIADLDNDPYPEVVIVSHLNETLYVFEHNGMGVVGGVPQVAPKWGPIHIPPHVTGNRAGPPVIADVDGDGEPEIGVAAVHGYAVFETVVDPNTQQLTLQEKWQFTTGDGSGLTSASAFDFNNDGRNEIVYGDENALFIFGAADASGATGTVLWSTPSRNVTSLEYPIVADVNGDGTAEIIKVLADWPSAPRGIRVYGNPLWPPTRAIWNQYSYHITNVNEDGSIPQVEANNWTTYNNYHENPVLSTCENPRRDVTVSGIRRDINNRQILYARVGNAGNVVTPANIGLGFYNGDPENGGTLITTLTLSNALNPGEYEELTWTVPAGTDALPLWVWVDNGEVFAEATYEANNMDNTGLYFTATPNTAPAVDAGPATVTILPGEILNLNGTATDADNLPIGVLEHTWTVTAAPEGGHVDITDPSALATTVQFTGRGVYTLRLTATDLDLPSWDDIEVTVSPLPPAQTPGLIGSPANGSSLTGLVPITLLEGATITSATLEMWPAYNPNAVTTLATNLSANGGDTLATLDTTRLSNDSYFIRLVGVDGTSQETHSVIMVTAVGENKPGRVKFTVTDLVVPVSGLPITIGRTYDSLERHLNGDFGYGWSLAIGNPRLEIDGYQNVTLTLPDGRRTTFYFTPQPMSLVFSQPHYTPEPGVYGSLTVPDCLLVSGGETGYICFLEGPFEPQTYTYTDPYGRVFTLDRDGTLHSIRDLNDNVLTFTENGISSNAGSLSVLFQRDAEGRITQIIDPAGNVYGYTYDAVGDLTQVTLPTVGSTPIDVDYTYGQNDLAHYFLTAQDPRGTTAATMVYYTDPQDQASYGRLQRVTDAGGNVTHYTYDLATNTTTITNPDNGVVRIHYDAMGYVLEETNPLNQTTHYTYDANHNLRAETNHLGQTTSYDYNAQGHRTSVTNALGQQVITIVYNQYGGPTTLTDALGQVWNVQYDARFNFSNMTDTLGTFGGYQWNLQGNPITYANGDGETTSYTYNAYGQKVSQTNAEGETTTYTCDLFGRTLSVTNAANEMTSYTYDALGRMLTVTDALGHITRFEYDQNGNRTAVVDSLNHRTEYTYNTLNLVTTVTYADLTTTTYEYDWRGNVIAETDQAGNTTRYAHDLAGQQTAVTVAEGTPVAATTFYVYDGAGRLIRQTDPLGRNTVYTYDPVGRLIQVSRPMGNITTYEYNAASQRIATHDANGYDTLYFYDVRGRLILGVYEDSTDASVTYDDAGRLASHTDQDNLTTTYAYDNAGRLISVRSPIHQLPNLPTASYTYDTVGNLTSIMDARGNVTSFQYDALNQQTRKTWPDNTYETYGYDAVGNLTQHVLAVGTLDEVTHGFQYNAMNRLTQATYGTQTYSYTYTPTGWRDTVADARGFTNYDYDAQGRITQIQFPDTHVVGYTYDRVGNRLSMTTPAGTTQYTYNDANLLSTVNGGSGATTYTYDEIGVLTGMLYPNGVNTTYTYDTVYHLTDIVQQNGSQILGAYHYTLDDMGNRTGVTEDDGSRIEWDYDNYYHLTREARYSPTNDLLTETDFTYDLAGNRLTETVDGVTTTSAYNNLDQETQSVTGSSTTTYVYDSRGNLEQISDGVNTTTYTWDAQDRLINAVTPNGTAVYVYDADGRRVQQTANGQVINYLWDELSTYGDVVLETNGSGATLVSYMIGSTGLISQNRNSFVSYYLHDGQSSIRTLIDNTGLVTDTYDYTAFGEIYSQTGTTPNTYAYGGQYLDNLTNLYNLRARYFSPASGRFISQDIYPTNLSNPVELNRYSYARNNPANYGDPSGLQSLANLGLLNIKTLVVVSVIAIGLNPAIQEALFRVWLSVKLLAAEAVSLIDSDDSESDENSDTEVGDVSAGLDQAESELIEWMKENKVTSTMGGVAIDVTNPEAIEKAISGLDEALIEELVEKIKELEGGSEKIAELSEWLEAKTEDGRDAITCVEIKLALKLLARGVDLRNVRMRVWRRRHPYPDNYEKPCQFCEDAKNRHGWTQD